MTLVPIYTKKELALWVTLGSFGSWKLTTLRVRLQIQGVGKLEKKDVDLLGVPLIA
jgi:hypothetical protein